MHRVTDIWTTHLQIIGMLPHVHPQQRHEASCAAWVLPSTGFTARDTVQSKSGSSAHR